MGAGCRGKSMKPKAGFLRSIKQLKTCSHFNQEKNKKKQITNVRNESNDITIDLTDIKRTIKKLFNTDEMDKSLEKYVYSKKLVT